MEDYKTGDYTDSDLSGYFGDSFKDWKITDFELCNYNKLIQLRKVLRDHGVYVDTGRTKPEVIEALMAAVKEEIPWPSPFIKRGLQSFEKREDESSSTKPFRKASLFEPRQKVEEEALETESKNPLFNLQYQRAPFNPQPKRPTLFSTSEAQSRIRPMDFAPQFNNPSQNTSHNRELGTFLKFYLSNNLKYSGQPNDSIRFKYNIFLDNCARASLPRTAYHNAFPTMLRVGALK